MKAGVKGWITREVAWPEAPAGVVAGLAGRFDELVWLDSSDASPGGGLNPPAGGRWSLVAWAPRAVVVQQSGNAELSVFGRRPVRGDSIWRLLRESYGANFVREPCGLGLTPGWIGFAGFAAAGLLERVACRAGPDEVIARFGLFEQGVVLDHGARRAFAVGVVGDEATETLDSVVSAWSEACAGGFTPPPVAAVLREMVPRAGFESAVRRAREYIAAGDIYQVNLAHRIGLEFAGDPLGAYVRLREGNPAAYGAFLRWEDRAIASVSPELFLEVRDGRVRTSPIKGTRPLSGEAARDDAVIGELLGSSKDAAELAMIVDLHRNDVGRVCRPGGVRVTNARRIERIPGVVHTVADIEGELASGRDGLDALMACFPAGSISGVPKIRAIDIIAELETTPRGAYTGAIGVLGLDGTASFSVAIRTLQLSAGRAELHVGGGIVADSEPAAEYEETLTKARRILAALGVEFGAGTG
ncbi:MAG: anthranilate synthase component 1 [Planctomycetota bacterium]